MPYRFREARERTGMSGSEAGRRLETSQAALSFWELGKRSPSAEMLCKMADLYGVTVDYLLGRTEYSDARSGESELVSDQALKALHGQPVWHKVLGWGLVDALSDRIIFVNCIEKNLQEADALYTLPEPFTVGYSPTHPPLKRSELEEAACFWVEPISPDRNANRELRGWYAYKGVYVQNEFGQRFYLDTYGAKWLAFQQDF